jgi:FixJ family two-component response regulator
MDMANMDQWSPSSGVTDAGQRIDSDAMVYIVDDDNSVRQALGNLFRSVGLRVQAHASAAEFLGQPLPGVAACLVLDIRLPGVSGLDLQRRLIQAEIAIPIIFVTGHGDIPMTVRAMRAGAVDFLTKPFRDQDILDAVAAALVRDDQARKRQRMVADLQSAYALLSAREREVMVLVTEGLLNKQVAARLGLSEITVKVHRGNVMRKMNARSLADLVRATELLGLRESRTT